MENGFAYLHSHFRRNFLSGSLQSSQVQTYFPDSSLVTSRLGLAMGLLRMGVGCVEVLSPFCMAGDNSLTGTFAGSTLGGATGPRSKAGEGDAPKVAEEASLWVDS